MIASTLFANMFIKLSKYGMIRNNDLSQEMFSQSVYTDSFKLNFEKYCRKRYSVTYGGGGRNSLTFMMGVIMSGHFLRPPIMLTKFFKDPKYVDHFLSF